MKNKHYTTLGTVLLLLFGCAFNVNQDTNSFLKVVLSYILSPMSIPMYITYSNSTSIVLRKLCELSIFIPHYGLPARFFLSPNHSFQLTLVNIHDEPTESKSILIPILENDCALCHSERSGAK